MLLSPDDIERFHSQGYLLVRGVVDGPELALLRDVTALIAREGMARQGHGHVYRPAARERWGDPPGDVDPSTSVYFRSDQLWERHPSLFALAAHPSLVALVAQCMGRPFMVANDALVCKPPHTNVVVPWHQDPPYWRDVMETPSDPDFDVDLFLDGCDAQAGGLWVLPGRHREGSIAALKQDSRALFEHPRAVALSAEPGDVLLHALTLPHASLGNRTASLRRILYLHYANEETFARRVVGERRWSHVRGGFSPEMIATFVAMVATRQRLGFAADYSPWVRITAHGLEPREPWTLPGCWA